jgi:flagellar hook-associated protein 2
MATIGGTSDIATLVAQLIDLERRSGARKVYAQDKDALTLRSATLTDLRAKLSALNTQVQALTRPGALSPLGAKTVVSSAPTVATATASTGTLSGTHTLLVTQLAKRSTLVSSQWTQSGTELANAAGAGSHTFRISVGGADTQVTVAVGGAEDNRTLLSAMAAAINGTDAKVSASVVHDSTTTARLVLTSDEPGATNLMTLADESGTLVASSGSNSAVPSSGTAGGYLYAADQLDARFVLDGLAITRGANVVTNALPGVTFTLTSPQAADAQPATLTVGPDQEAIKTNVQAFLDAYNATIAFLKDRTGVSVSTETRASGTTDVTSVNRGTLASEAVYLGLLMNLRADVAGRITTGATGGPVALSEIGITAGRDGVLSIGDTTKFAKALTEDADAVAALFNSSDGIAARLSARLDGFVKTGGPIDTAVASTTARLQSVNRAIAQQEAYLRVKQATLLQQYTMLQETLLQLQEQQATLDSITALYAV